jgi:hypothetical protein
MASVFNWFRKSVKKYFYQYSGTNNLVPAHTNTLMAIYIGSMARVSSRLLIDSGSFPRNFLPILRHK